MFNERPLPPIPQSSVCLSNYSWFHNVERDEAERILCVKDIDGGYIVRKSRRAGLNNPYTLTLYYRGKIFHLNIRQRHDNLYALGKEKFKEKVLTKLLVVFFLFRILSKRIFIYRLLLQLLI